MTEYQPYGVRHFLRVGTRIGQLNNAGQYTSLGGITLQAGVHAIELRYSGGLLAPGGGGPEYGLGPLVVTADRDGRCRSTLEKIF
jgi:hypothetical protein